MVMHDNSVAAKPRSGQDGDIIEQSPSRAKWIVNDAPSRAAAEKDFRERTARADDSRNFHHSGDKFFPRDQLKQRTGPPCRNASTITSDIAVMPVTGGGSAPIKVIVLDLSSAMCFIKQRFHADRFTWTTKCADSKGCRIERRR